MIFVGLVLYLRCHRHVPSQSSRGFQRYNLLGQDDEDNSPMISSINERKVVRNSHAQPSESENDEEEIFSASIIDRRPLLS